MKGYTFCPQSAFVSLYDPKKTAVFSYKDMPLLRQLVAHLSPWRFGFDPMSFHVRFMVDKVALGLV